MQHWGNRWRRGVVTKNYHWRASMLSRFGNLLCGKGFKTNAEYFADQAQLIADASGNRIHIPRSIGARRLGIAIETVSVQCRICGKKFTRKLEQANRPLKAHKDSDGIPCFGRLPEVSFGETEPLETAEYQRETPAESDGKTVYCTTCGHRVAGSDAICCACGAAQKS